VVAKPPGLLVHRSTFMPRAEAALQVLRDQLGRHVYPIHRLDRQASGCLLFATTREWAGPLSAALTAPTAQKTYLAFVRGNFKGDGPVTADRPMKDDNGILKEALSVVWRLGGSPDPRCSLLRVEPRTGRYHQVRRHVRDLTHPILGDLDHGDSKVNRWWRENEGVDRLGLHCLSLSLDLPEGGRLEVTCPLFADHAAVWRRMPWWDEARAALPALELPPLPLRTERRRWRPEGTDTSDTSDDVSGDPSTDTSGDPSADTSTDTSGDVSVDEPDDDANEPDPAVDALPEE
jgi:tRNA pseudouridine65 synthase